MVKKFLDPVQRLYNALREEALEEVRRHTKPAQRFRASEASKCGRQIYYRLQGYRPAPKSPRLKVYGVEGDAAHDLTRQMFVHYGIPVEGVKFEGLSGKVVENDTIVKEFTVIMPDGETAKVTVSGRADGILPETPVGRALLEIKSMGFYKYKYLREAMEKQGPGGAMARVKDKHRDYEWQIETTMRLFDEERACLIVKERDSGTLGLWVEHEGSEFPEYMSIYFERDDERWQKVLRHFATIKRHIDKNEPPMREYPSGSQECKQCDFFYLCHGADERRMKGKKPAILYPGPQIDDFQEGDQCEST